LRLLAAHVACLHTSPERWYCRQLQNVYRNVAQLVGELRVPTEIPCQHSLAGSSASNPGMCAHSLHSLARCAGTRLFLAGSSHLRCCLPVRLPGHRVDRQWNYCGARPQQLALVVPRPDSILVLSPQHHRVGSVPLIFLQRGAVPALQLTAVDRGCVVRLCRRAMHVAAGRPLVMHMYVTPPPLVAVDEPGGRAPCCLVGVIAQPPYAACTAAAYAYTCLERCNLSVLQLRASSGPTILQLCCVLGMCVRASSGMPLLS
jgi:hypothetical protein